MPAINHAYDPTGSAVANKFTNEVHPFDKSVDLAVFSNEGPFYNESLVAEGLISGTWTPLVEQTDYILSPMFLSVAASTRRDPSSYIIVINPDVTSIKLTYQAVGYYEDVLLLQEIVNKPAMDRSSLTDWLSIKGSGAYWDAKQRHPEKDLLQIISQQLNNIEAGIANPHTSSTNLAGTVNELAALITSSVASIEALQTNIKTETLVAANTPELIHVFTFGETALLHVEFVPTNVALGRSSHLINAAKSGAGSVVDSTISSVLNGRTVTLGTTVTGGRINVRGQVDVPGTFIVKPLNVG